MEKNRIKLIVCSQNLTIVSEEPPSYIYRVAEEVNKRVDDMLSCNRYHPMISALVLCAMQYCDENIKLSAHNDELKEEISRLSQENKELTAKLKEEEEAHRKLQKDYKELRNNRNAYNSSQRSFFEKTADNAGNQPIKHNK